LIHLLFPPTMPISRITDKFAECRKANKGLFVAFITAGCPSPSDTVPAMLELQAAGTDIIELGIPFSDPMADGTTIQQASEKALKQGMNLRGCLALVKEARAKGVTVPIIFMGYYNNLLSHGLEWVCKECAAAGSDGFIVVDLPPEESSEFLTHCNTHDLSIVPMIAPTSTPERIKSLAAVASSFIYVASVAGVTGQRANVSSSVASIVKTFKDQSDGMPCIVGFGVSTEDHVREVTACADGVVVGSAIVTALEKGIPEMGALVRKLTKGCQGHSAGSEPPTKRAKIDMGAGDKWKYSTGFGGRFIPETLMKAHEELEEMYNKCKVDPEFIAEVARLRKEFIGGPTPLYHAKRLSEKIGGAQIWFKREELAHTGAHKINNAVGQALLAKKIGKNRIIAETGAGQHGVATATACALLGMECIVYMGAVDVERQKLNVFRMKMLGAKVVAVQSGSRTLKDAINEAMRDWVTNIVTTHYIIGSAVGPHPFPTIVKDFQSVIGREARAQMLNEQGYNNGPGRLPDMLVACVGGGSNAIGVFADFLGDKDVKIVGVEAGGHAGPPRPDGTGSAKHSATLTAGTKGVLHGSVTYLLQDDHGQIMETHSISAGLDYPGVGPEHAHLRDSGRVSYHYATDTEALDALQFCAQTEGILPALEPSHALAWMFKEAKTMSKDKIILMNLCGRGDKDMLTVAAALGVTVD